MLVLGSPSIILQFLDKHSANTSDRHHTALVPLSGQAFNFGLMRYGSYWRRRRRAAVPPCRKPEVLVGATRKHAQVPSQASRKLHGIQGAHIICFHRRDPPGCLRRKRVRQGRRTSRDRGGRIGRHSRCHRHRLHGTGVLARTGESAGLGAWHWFHQGVKTVAGTQRSYDTQLSSGRRRARCCWAKGALRLWLSCSRGPNVRPHPTSEDAECANEDIAKNVAAAAITGGPEIVFSRPLTPP